MLIKVHQNWILIHNLRYKLSFKSNFYLSFQGKREHLSKIVKHSASVRSEKPKSSARETRQGDLYSFFHADSENQIFDMHFSLRSKFFFH